jgi:hypothetical protein
MYIPIPDWIWPILVVVAVIGGIKMLLDLVREIINTFRNRRL